MNRMQNICFEYKKHIYRPKIVRKFMSEITLFIGIQCMIMSRKLCDFVCNMDASQPYKNLVKESTFLEGGFA